MLVDLDALHRAGDGDQDAKVAVRKAWLKQVHAELAELQRLRARHAVGDALSNIGDRLFGLGTR